MMKGSKLLCCCRSKKGYNNDEPVSPFGSNSFKEPTKNSNSNGEGMKKVNEKETISSNNKNTNDSRIPLTERQKFLLIKNWKGISRRARDAGTNLFVQLLSEHQELGEYFKFGNVKEKDKYEMMADEKIQNHGEAVMRILDSVITSVNDPQEMFRILEEQGKEHATKKNFKPELFREVEDALFYSIKLILDERYTDNMDNIYRIVMKTILKTLEDSCREEMIRLGILKSQ
ncbi:Globin family and Globin-like domain and Globin, structural domain-containing protein [Strongyloides ratti]|uniref:Globin family and Globin-like domain and Globin, structural domain-containing protein n=1 Tax=Strongyloides ratti TaxID=34506 RepID=A0A090MU88_STRRB|nr:Globin family and Globin-like domain and Globin, structural domain-containing protein [Strongyloides ratti]CEF62068.1 Globin family and Globin-like domain and Globin, structural domain-containing protein [Strongyloides ratti]